MNKFIKIFTMFFLITFSSTLYADAPGPVNLSLKGIVDWVRFFQFVEYGTTLPSTPSTRGVWFILWVNNEPALYWSNGSEWIAFVSAGVQDGSVDTDALADGAVTTPKLANSAVTSEKLMNSAVTTNKIADNAITGTKFANNSITTAKLANSSVTSEKLGYLSVGTNNIQNGAVISEKIESTIRNKNIILNNGEISNPSLSFSSNQTSGLSFNSASNTIDISLSASDKVKIGNSFVDLNNISDGLTLSSLDEKINVKSDGIHYNDDVLSVIFDNNILASGSLLPSENLTFDLGSSTARWNNIFNKNMNAENITVASDTFVKALRPLDNASSIGSGNEKFSGIWTNSLTSDFIYLGGDYLQNKIMMMGDVVSIDGANKDVLKLQNSIIPANNNSYYLGISDKNWKGINAVNASVTRNITASNMIASESVESLNIISTNASFSDVITNNIEASGIASFSSLLVGGNPVTGVENFKYPRGELSVDVDCGKYSLRSLGKDLILFSDSWMMIDYNVTDNGNYFTFKTGNASSAVMIMDSIATMTTATIRLDYENIMSDTNLKYLFGIENSNGNYVVSLFSNNGNLYLSFLDSVNDVLINFDTSGYVWSNEHNLYLIIDFSETGYVNWKFNIDGINVYSEKTTVSANTTGNFNVSSIHVGDGNGNGGTYSISQDFNAKYRRIQIYPYELSVKEMSSIPVLEPMKDQNRELSKNMTKCPYYTLGEPSTLISGDFNEGEGFFGEVSGDKFIYPWEVLAQLWNMDSSIDTKAKFIASFTADYSSIASYTFSGDSYTALGVSDNLEVEWLKFYDHGKIIFIPKRPLLNSITWNEINNAMGNCAVGKEIKIDLRRNNALINQTYSNGNLVTVRCRLLTGGNIQPWIYGNVNERGVKDNALCMGSEWNRLMYRICDQIPSDTFAGVMQGYSGGKQLGDNWFNFTSSDLGFGASNDLGRVTPTQEYCYHQNSIFVSLRSSDGGIGIITYLTSSNRPNYEGFRPALVLEVMK